ncbi:CDGSH iron-sulfur domain-containing protein [Streptomyces tubbatahanensis]|uniref:CDGSH iron-sulfur domain-containing protein n=1 Tax=Streptomyces tubbatahanensis TaxID=2923272 RepID=A0ABY3Y0T1_9ACTN|nr:CDGSH iron-sulfur domain-containing protein [Streptomyces tubbatahanensis]UNS99873.1 CDGSH iron-sulfur domain-containing protein [Streptomyces tubbatahanensis]
MTLEQGGPVLVEGPLEVTLDDGRTVTSDRFMVALCTCRRSRTYPWCDTSHRRRSRPGAERTPADTDASAGCDAAGRRRSPHE